MASGRVHNKDNTLIVAANISASPLYYFFLAPDELGFLRFVVINIIISLSTYVINPDTDLQTTTSNEWKLVKYVPYIGYAFQAFWHWYAVFIPHGHFISHFPVISTVFRLIYIFIHITLVEIFLYSVSYIDNVILINLLVEMRPSYIILLTPLFANDFLHWIRDEMPVRNRQDKLVRRRSA